ncbi:MAG: hypothetical protein MSA53_05230 [Bacteroidales bacterium]|nr:hypothetical protein [Bacteroidales bacterium]
MDVDLLSKMVKELILDSDEVVLPGLGAFRAEIVPASFSDKGYTINPPYRRMFFRSKPDQGDSLALFYASSNNVSFEVASRIIRDFVSDLRSVLYERKTVILPGLGRLRATKENNVFFVADENLDIYPEGFALEAISLKNHVQTREEVSAAVQGLADMLDIKAPQEASQEEPQEAPQEAPQPDPEPVAAEVDAEPVVEKAVPAEAEIAETESVEAETEEAAEETLPAETETAETETAETETAETVEETLPAETETVETVPVEESVVETAEESVVEEPSPVVEELEPEPVSQPVMKKSPWRIVLKAALWTLATLVVVAGLFFALSRFAPRLIDRLLYSAEELEILYHQDANMR